MDKKEGGTTQVFMSSHQEWRFCRGPAPMWSSQKPEPHPIQRWCLNLPVMESILEIRPVRNLYLICIKAFFTPVLFSTTLVKRESMEIRLGKARVAERQGRAR